MASYHFRISFITYKIFFRYRKFYLIKYGNDAKLKKSCILVPLYRIALLWLQFPNMIPEGGSFPNMIPKGGSFDPPAVELTGSNQLRTLVNKFAFQPGSTAANI